MKSNLVRLAAIAFGLSFTLPGPAAPGQQAEHPPGQAATFGVGTSAVVLDVVVRDKKGRPVTDLGAADFEVYEDGVLQRVQSFQGASVEPLGPPPEAPAVAAAGPPASGQPGSRVVAFVFDRLSQSGRTLAQKAAVTYLDHGHPSDHLVGVFAIDLSLTTLQTYTNSPVLIRRALERASTAGVARHASQREAIRGLAERNESLEAAREAASAGPTEAGPAGGAAAAAAGATAGLAEVERTFNEMTTRMLQAFETLERDQQGYATTNALLAVVHSMRALLGRKSVVFFSEGLALPPAVQAHFRSVIHAANLANVTIYALDAGGLRAESMTAETRQEIQATARARLRQLGTGRDDGGILMKAMERNEDMLRFDPHSGLGQLAEETGGLLIRDTNDLEAGFRRLQEDMRFHYMLAYSPQNETFDGRFREVQVKVRRPGLAAHTRRGYLAVPPAGPLPVLVHEAPALALLDRNPRPQAFPLRAVALSFPEPKRPGLVPIVVEVPGNTLTYLADPKSKAYRAEFTILARVRDQSGHVVRKLSQYYPLGGPLEQIEGARQGGVLFYREADIPPGTYTVDAVAYDALARAASTRTTSLVVPAAEEGQLRLSSIMLVKRVERVPEAERESGHPLMFGEALLYPNLEEPLSRSTEKQLAFFFTAYTDSAAPAPKATVEILAGGRRLAQTSLALPPRDSSGRIQHVGALPLEAFSPGPYELRVVLSDSRSLQSRSVTFTVEE